MRLKNVKVFVQPPVLSNHFGILRDKEEVAQHVFTFQLGFVLFVVSSSLSPSNQFKTSDPNDLSLKYACDETSTKV